MGKPTASAVFFSEYIGKKGDTRGTETSKYPKEKKSTEIPLVAASEGGVALYILAYRLVEHSGKDGHSR